MKGLLAVVGIGAAAVFAQRRGLIGTGSAAGADLQAASVFDTPPEQPVNSDLRPNRTRPVPILSSGEVAEIPHCEAILRRNPAYVSNWARRHMGWAAAIMQQESAGRRTAIGDGGRAIGLYQVHIPTAETCFRAGYQDFPATRETLLTEEGAVYFGTAEMERLSRINSNLNWIICAYNGGQGWETMGERYREQRQEYLAGVQNKFVRMYGQGEATT